MAMPGAEDGIRPREVQAPPTQSTDLAAVTPRAAAASPPPAEQVAWAPELVSLPGGTFRMGSNDDPSEQPLHNVVVKPLLVGAHAVTVGEWQRCFDAKACPFALGGKPDELARDVSWNDASQYASWLAKATGQPYRLPTEAEWEYAARAGTQTRYSWGDAMLPGKVSCKGCGAPVEFRDPPRADALPPNQFGLYAMGGGVDEWVADCWHRNFQGAPHDGSVPWDAPDCKERVLRGGSWVSEASAVRVSNRDYYDASVRYPTHGFRVARSP